MDSARLAHHSFVSNVGFTLRMPQVIMMGMRVQVSARLEEFVAEVQVEMVCLQVRDDEYRGNRTGELLQRAVHVTPPAQCSGLRGRNCPNRIRP